MGWREALHKLEGAGHGYRRDAKGAPSPPRPLPSGRSETPRGLER